MWVLWMVSACCNGPIAAVECIAPGVYYDVLSEDGEPFQPDAVRVYLDGELISEERCDPALDDCRSGRVPVDTVGAYRIEVDAFGGTVAEQIFVDEVEAEGECCGGFSAVRQLVVPGTTCPELDEPRCASAAACAPLSAWPVDECVAYDRQVVVGCGYADLGCDDVITWAGAPGGDCYVFPDSCLPAGFVPCASPFPEECAP